MDQFKKIYSEYRHKVYFFVKKYIQKNEDAEDVVQDIFVHIWKYLDKVDAKTPIEAVIFKTCKQEVSHFYRKNKLAFAISDQNVLKEEVEEALDENDNEERISKITVLLDKLPQKTRELFIQHTIEKMSYSQLAKENNISKSAIGKHINKALHFLKVNLH